MSQTTIWAIIFFGMIIFELVTLGNLVSIWFAIGALGSLVVSLVSDSITIQVIIFVVLSVASLIFVRPITHKILKGSETATNADRLIGKTYVLNKEVTKDEWGLMKINGDEWSVTTADHSEIEAGTLVEVVAIEGVKLIVKKVQGGN